MLCVGLVLFIVAWLYCVVLRGVCCVLVDWFGCVRGWWCGWLVVWLVVCVCVYCILVGFDVVCFTWFWRVFNSVVVVFLDLYDFV